MKNDKHLAKYLADYLAEELARSTSLALWEDDLENFADNLPDVVENGIAAFRGGAAEGYPQYGNVPREEQA